MENFNRETIHKIRSLYENFYKQNEENDKLQLGDHPQNTATL